MTINVIYIGFIFNHAGIITFTFLVISSTVYTIIITIVISYINTSIPNS